MDIKHIAAIALATRLLSLFFITIVIRRQWKLLKTPIDKEIVRFRQILFALCVVIFLGNLIPVTIDSLTLFADLKGRGNPQPIGVAYVISNCLTAVISSLFIWIMYRLAQAGTIGVIRPPRNPKERDRKTDRK